MENVFQIAVLRVCLATLAVLLAALALVGLRQVGRQLLRQLKPIALAALLIDFLGRVESLGTVVFALAIARFVLWVIAFVRSCKGSTDPVPLVGDIHIIN